MDMNLKSDLFYTDIVQTYLTSMSATDSKVEEHCIVAVEAYVHLDRSRHLRIIALIRKHTSHAVVIFKDTKPTNHNIHEIHVVDVLPLNLGFKLDTDKTRFPDGDIQPVIISGEDFTLLDFDPLSSPVSSNNGDAKDFNRKIFCLDFSKEDFYTFSIRLSNACKFIIKEEKFSSFDWLKKLKDETNAVSTNFECDNDVPIYDYDSISTYDSLVPNFETDKMVNEGISTSLTCSKSRVNAISNIRKSAIKKSDRQIHESFDSFLSNGKCSEHYQSSPDLLNLSFENLLTAPSLLSNTVNDIRHSAYIEKKLRYKEKEYCVWEDYTLFVGTWNVNGRIDDSIRLDKWLTPANDDKFPNIYVLGFQEIDLSIGSVAMNRGNMSSLEERWLKLIETSEPFRRHSYKRLYRSRLAGILMIAYIDKKLTKFVPHSQVMANKVPTGVFNVMGNKGAVGIRFRVCNSNLCFINCHLAAGESNRMRRDQDFREIEKNLIFYDEFNQGVSVYEHDLVFLMGDLNYRILNIDASIVKDLAIKKKIERLLDNDELLNESKLVFKRFNEDKITFPPTYKFDPNTDEYDTSEKNRVPSYCDRIMWMGDHCKILDYSSHMSLKTSDHKPVSALFTVGLKKIDQAKRIKVHEAIIRDMDYNYNLSLPQAKLDRQEINFECIHFYEHRQASISITNTGQNEFTFNFKEIPGCPKIPDWLTVQPSVGTVKINDTCELIFEIFINANNVSELNTKSDVQCILILTLLGGKDYFITVTADLVPTSFGLPLSLLVSLKSPVATLSRHELFEMCVPFMENIQCQTQTLVDFSTAKEIYVMIDYLLKNIGEEELFARPGTHSEIQFIREQLDTHGINAEFSTVCVHSVAEAMLMFLSALYFPIIPSEFIGECTKSQCNYRESIKVISKLPIDHQNLFHYLTRFLRKVLDNRSHNGTDISSLGILFVDLIFRLKSVDSSERELCSQFIKQFIEKDSINYWNSVPSLH